MPETDISCKENNQKEFESKLPTILFVWLIIMFAAGFVLTNVCSDQPIQLGTFLQCLDAFTQIICVLIMSVGLLFLILVLFAL
jgi:hypothetical protein